jgi:hypothetical protein
LPTVADPQQSKSALEPFRARVRRIQFVVGMGFLAAVAGAVFSVPLLVRLEPRLAGLGPWLGYVPAFLIARLWIVAALPGIAYVAARVLPLEPTSTAFGAAITGELFYVALQVVSGGWAALYPGYGPFALRLCTLALGILLTLRAVRAGRAAAQKAQEAAAKLAEAKKSEYAEFAAEAERLAARSEAKANAAPPAAGTPPPEGPASTGT